jgi:hypothetical protein
MEPNEVPRQDHCDHVEQLVCECPTEWTKQELERICGYRYGVRKPHALSRENWCL